MAEGQYFIEGYAFSTKEEYNVALREQKNINAIRTKMNMNDKESVLLIYKKLTNKKLLISPLGIAFMKELRDHLIYDFKMEESELPMMTVVSRTTSALERSKQYTTDQLMKEIKKKEKTILTLRIVIFGCVVIIIGMFAINLLNDDKGYFNYEDKIIDKYSSWEEELDQREQKVKDQEEKLGIGNEQE